MFSTALPPVLHSLYVCAGVPPSLANPCNQGFRNSSGSLAIFSCDPPRLAFRKAAISLFAAFSKNGRYFSGSSFRLIISSIHSADTAVVNIMLPSISLLSLR